MTDGSTEEQESKPSIRQKKNIYLNNNNSNNNYYHNSSVNSNNHNNNINNNVCKNIVDFQVSFDDLKPWNEQKNFDTTSYPDILKTEIFN